MAAKILLAENDAVIRNDISDHLQKEGYEVIAAADGIQALEMFNQDRFDLVITDLAMPQLDGFKLAERIHSRSPKTPIIFMTAYLSMKLGKTILQGMAEFIEKPVALEILLPMLRDLLRPKSTPGREEPTKIIYRRKIGSESWHFHAGCSNWPTGAYEEQLTAPIGEFCNECEAKHKQQNRL
jgi:two-component system, cell cycle response regulator CpdR